MPTVVALLGRWFPAKEHSSAIALVYTGQAIGTIISMVVSPLLVERWGWEYIFYWFAGIGGVWSVFWLIFGASSAEGSRFITADELAYIKSHQRSSAPKEQDPWRSLLRSSAVWSVIINAFCGNWGFYILLAWLPTYMEEELNFNLKQSGFLSETPYIANVVVGIFIGLVTDALVRRGAPLLFLRKLNHCIGTLVPALLFGFLCFHHESYVAVITMVGISGLSMFCLASYLSTPLDIAPRYAGVILGFSNTAGTIPGIFGVLSTGYILQHTNHNWCVVFLITAGINVVGCGVYLFLASAKLLMN